MSFIVPTNECTLSDLKAFRGAAVEAGISQALAHGIARERSGLVVRHALPFTDFGTLAVNGWQIEAYRNPVIAAAGWGSIFDGSASPLVAAPTLAPTKVAVFFKFADYTAAPVINGVRFRIGGTGASTLGTFFMQLETGAKLEPDVYFSEPIVYAPQDVVFIEAYYAAGVAALGETFAFGCYIVERLGANVS